jgi:hypothetical protein
MWLPRYDFQSLAAEQFHDQVGTSVLLADIVDGANIRMVQCCGGASFAQEALMGEMSTGVRRAGGRGTA